MTEDSLPLAELLAKAGDGDFLRSVAEAVVQLQMETDVEGLIGAGRHERSGDRTDLPERLSGPDGSTPGWAPCSSASRSCGRACPCESGGSDFPPFLEPRRTSEKALVAVIQG